MPIINPLSEILASALACTGLWTFYSAQKNERVRHEAEIAKIQAERAAEIAKTEADALRKIVDAQAESAKRSDDEWRKIGTERSAVNTRFDTLQSNMLKDSTNMFNQIVELRKDLGNAQEALGEARGHIKAAEMEAERYKENYNREVASREMWQARVLVLEEKIRVYEDSRINITETFIQTKTPKSEADVV